MLRKRNVGFGDSTESRLGGETTPTFLVATMIATLVTTLLLSTPIEQEVRGPELPAMLTLAAARIDRSACSGAPVYTIDQVRETLDSIVSELLVTIPRDASSRERVRRVFEFLHRRILRGDFDRWQSRIDVLIASGDYNCVSSTFLFVDLCRATGVPANVVAFDAHVAARVDSLDGMIVETTVPDWNRQPDRKSLRGDPRDLSDSAALSRVHYNYGVRHCHWERYADGIRHFELSLRLDSANTEARRNRNAAYNNWAVDLADAGRYDKALAILRKARNLDPEGRPARSQRESHPTSETQFRGLVRSDSGILSGRFDV